MADPGAVLPTFAATAICWHGRLSMEIAAGYEPAWHLRTPGAALVAAISLVFVAASPPAPAYLEVHKDERLFVIAPHPDDATLGAGGLIQQVLGRGGTARDVLVTAGDGYVAAVAHEVGARRPCPAEYVAYGEQRIREARAALREFGGPARLQLLGFPDGGIERLLHAHWQRTHPERSPTTGAEHPPYRTALHPSVAYDGADFEAELVQLLREGQPTLVALP